jgi:HD-GYP domain-containing protein (c-di-GMP phosphodiesterase class II)
MYAGEGIDVRKIQTDQRKIPRLYCRGEYRHDVAELTQKGFYGQLGHAFASGDLEAIHGTMTEIMPDVFVELTSKDQHDHGGFDALHSIVDLLTSCLKDRTALQSLATMANEHFTLSIHACRVSAYAAMFANYHRLPQDEARPICMAGLLADVGKVGIPEAILLAESRLEDGSDDLARLQAHPVIGAEILYTDGLDDMFILAGVREHHERQDGSGYPQGMTEFTARRGVKIGEVIAIADSLDSLAPDHRPTYRAAAGVNGALAILKREADEREVFDPEVYSAVVQGVGGQRVPKVKGSQ